MLITNDLTKKKLEELIKQSFQFLSFSQASKLGDYLKGVGFYYATASGISISLEDLKTPAFKNELVQEIKDEFEEMSQKWATGLVSDLERFQNVLSNWNNGAEVLKEKIVEHFKINDPLNTLYIMAFSGARGNMSQVRQVIGMRGLMVNQAGDIIDLPIQANFREGLSSIDYIVSSYGARKGVVDTALKTADAGYLTRRLIYVVQEITIKSIDCNTSLFQTYALFKESSTKNLLGKAFVKLVNFNGQSISLDFESPQFLTEDFLMFLKKKAPAFLFYRSPINCLIKNGLCQKCYGFDASKGEIISLGLSVGIIAAQSIGEPGTQLTMRTFHTGGIFTGQFSKYETSPLSGKLYLPLNFETKMLKTFNGKIVPLLLEDIFATIVSWEGKKKTIFIPRSSFLYFTESSFIKKNQILSESKKEAKFVSEKKRHPLRAPFDGLIVQKNLFVRTFREKNLKVTKENSTLWLTSGKLYETGINTKFLKKKFLNKESAFAFSKILTPIHGIICINKEEKKIKISNRLVTASLSFDQLANDSFKNECELILKNFSFIDAHSIIAYLYFYPSVNERIYRVKKSIYKEFPKKSLLFFITEKDIWRIYSDTEQQFRPKNGVIFHRHLLAPNLEAPSSGILLNKDGFKYIYQKAIALAIPSGTLLSFFKGKFLKKDQTLAHFILSKQKGEDIVQGLPKIEELLEARKIKKTAITFSNPLIFLGNWFISGILSYSQNLKQKNPKSIIYKIGVSSYEENMFKLYGKTRKLPLSKLDKRAIRKLQRKEYFLLNFFKGFCYNKSAFFFRNAFFDATPFQRIDSFSFYQSNINITAQKLDFKTIANFTIDNAKTRSLEKTKLKSFNNQNNILSFQKENQVKEKLLISFPYIRFPKFPKSEKTINFKRKQITREFSDELSSFINLKIEQEKNKKIFLSSTSQGSLFSKEKKWHRFQAFTCGYSYFLVQPAKIKARISEFLDIGRQITQGRVDSHKLLSNLFYYHYSKDNFILGVAKSVYKLQLIFLNSIQSIYRSQGVEILNIHIELILRELTSKAKIKFSHGEIFYANEIISLSCANELLEIYDLKRKKELFYEPLLLPISKASIQKEGFLAAAGFQETRFVLTKAAIEGKKDWLRGLKESVINGRAIPAGSGFLNQKNYLDTLFYYKNN